MLQDVIPTNWDGSQTAPTALRDVADGLCAHDGRGIHSHRLANPEGAFVMSPKSTDKESFQAVVYDARGNGQGETSPTITGDHQDRITDYSAIAVEPEYVVRRLTPVECERLQGFPDGWTDIGEWVDTKGKKHKPADSPRYKALGNSIAVGYANNCSGFWKIINS